MTDSDETTGEPKRPGGGALTSIEGRSLSIEAYRQLRRTLTTGVFQPGQRLNVRELAESLGTSVTPVREALLQLVAEGALELRARHAITVPVLSQDAYLELRDLRMEMEGMGAARAARRITATAIGKLESQQEKLVAAKERKDFKAALRWNEMFHLTLCREAGMPRLLRIVEGLWVQSGPLLNMLYVNAGGARPSGKPHHHELVIAALRERDSEAARAAIQADIAGGTTALLEQLRR